ncbi:KICSTOR complex protein C12orf66 [Eurytemora carolleeae]|uniref:KICSTOR complex protein C12orf66 n=1 Tax=Eurytemora carolleeae TaxID=1294199 RepID=UPI000C76E40F|nr:KICSTOR complex protein C12orf66 [Eurytemora carolleeae]|eukprot:XP_023332425.1 KICSTOR complex protein C12orf66-like [Eurytemora affinis]
MEPASESTLKHLYETMICELERLLECNEAVEAEDIITHLSTDLGVILKGRLKSMDVYEKLNNSNKLTVYTELQVVLRFISKTVKDVHSVAVDGWKQVFYLEIGILYDSVQMCISMGNCDFYNSTTFLQSLTDKLSTWAEILSTRETRKLSFATSLLRGVSGQSEPHLYTWFYKLKAALLSKFSIYFYSVLLNQSGGDMRALTSKLPVDHPNRLISFHRRTDALTVCIVFDGTGLSGFRGPGYFFQTDRREGGSPTGLELFPAVFYHPVISCSILLISV